MAEYIDRKKINLYGFFDAGDYSQAMRCINNMPTANVVEKEKINKALDRAYEMRNKVLSANNCYEPNDVLDIIDQITKLFEEM